MIETTYLAYPNFTKDEFTCKCDCGVTNMDRYFLTCLQSLRNSYNRPMVITSGYRCPDYNDRMSTTGRDGPHTTGMAADIYVTGEDAYDLLVDVFERTWFTGIGVHQRGRWNQRFIHLDTIDISNISRPRIWTY